MNILKNYVKICMHSFRKVQMLMNPNSGHQNGNRAILKMLLIWVCISLCQLCLPTLHHDKINVTLNSCYLFKTSTSLLCPPSLPPPYWLLRTIKQQPLFTHSKMSPNSFSSTPNPLLKGNCPLCNRTKHQHITCHWHLSQHIEAGLANLTAQKQS